MTRFVATGPASRLRPLARRALVAAVAAMCLLAAACSDDDSSAAGESEESTTSSRPTTTTEAEVEAGRSESDQLRQRIQELLHSYDEILGEIGAQPDVASDRASPEYDELRALLAPESPMADPLINALVAAGSRGERQLALDGQRFPVERSVSGQVRDVSNVEFVVPVCGRMNYGVFNGQNQQIELAEDHIESSDATIVLIGDDLRIERFDAGDPQRCQEATR